MKKNIVLLFFICLSSCYSEKFLYKDLVTKIVYSNEEKRIIIDDKKAISNIVKKINNAVYEPCIFPPEEKVDVYFGDSIKTIICYSNYILIDGKPYRLREPLKTYFK